MRRYARFEKMWVAVVMAGMFGVIVVQRVRADCTQACKYGCSCPPSNNESGGCCKPPAPLVPPSVNLVVTIQTMIASGRYADAASLSAKLTSPRDFAIVIDLLLHAGRCRDALGVLD